MPVSKAIAFALVLAGQSARFKRSSSHSKSVTIAGIEVHNYKPNNAEWIVVFDASATDSTIDTLCQGRCSFQGHPSELGVPFATVHGSEAELEEMLKGAPLVDHLETDHLIYAIPEIESYETRSLASWGLERVGADSRPTTGRGVHIYVQDTGIRTSHTDFGGRASSALDMSTGGTECGGSASCAGDVQGHGSHCAGTAGGTTFGVAPDALLYAVKTLSDEGSGQMSWQYAGIDYVATKGKKPAVLSMSLGGPGKDTGFDAAFRAANNAGVVVVAAAGNSNTDTCTFSPAFSKEIITVGATDSNNKRASYSNYGTCNDIMAPGSAITSVNANGDRGTLTISGTSMACPHVSGAAALLLESNPRMGKQAVLNKLLSDGLPNYIEGLHFQDPIHFLYVGTRAPPAYDPKPVSPPPAVTCRRRWFCQ